jgi:hypothetical protein
VSSDGGAVSTTTAAPRTTAAISSTLAVARSKPPRSPRDEPDGVGETGARRRVPTTSSPRARSSSTTRPPV